MKKTNQQLCSYKHRVLSKNDKDSWNICDYCQLIYADRVRDEEYYINNNLLFDEYPGGNTNEFLSIIKKFQKIIKIKTNFLSFFDFGCGAGAELLEAKKIFQHVGGFEPNKSLSKKCINNSLNVIDNFDKISKLKKVDVCFARNPFKYVDNFIYSFQTFTGLIDEGGYLIWRDKYFDWIPRPELNLNKKKTSTVETFLLKKTIIFHIQKNNLKIIFKRFYYDDTFLIIAKKNAKKKIFNQKKIFNLIIFNENIINIIHFVRSLLSKLKINLRKLIFFSR